MGGEALRAAALVLSLAASDEGAVPAPRPGQATTPAHVAALLSDLHPDYARFIGTIRYGRTRLRPATLYAGLVKSGGADPRDPGDAPVRRGGAPNDLIIYADTFEPWRSAAWRRLIADHEYFHARHLAGGFAIPLAGFQDAAADGDYLEALAWGYVLERARGHVYGDLAPGEWSELRSRYSRHQERFRRFILARQPPAWAHYGRFLPDEDAAIRPLSAPTAGPSPAADRAP